MSIFTRFYNYLVGANQWYLKTSERALDQAYNAALMIKSIEDEYFEGEKIPTASDRYSPSELSYFKIELKNYLKIIRTRLIEFKASSSFLGAADRQVPTSDGQNRSLEPYFGGDRSSIILNKLNLIDQIRARYTAQNMGSKPETNGQSVSLIKSESAQVNPDGTSQRKYLGKNLITSVETITDKTGVLPRSILGTVNRIKRELDPQAEAEVVKNFRSSKNKTIISIRFVLLIALIPLLVQQVSKNFIVGPIVEHLNVVKVDPFLNFDMEDEALHKLKIFESKLKFQNVISDAPDLSPAQIKNKVKLRAIELAAEYARESNNAIKNLFADLISLIVFAIVVFIRRSDFEVLKSFIDEIIYGLSDSAKAFIIILSTDIFVGFHSPHGWEILLENVSHHLGLPYSREFIFLFIATFPVILDTVFKYWIFRFLNRISPSAVATYRTMNE